MMRMVVLSGLLAGCATVSDYPNVDPSAGTWTIRGDYQVGDRITVATGMPMVVSGQVREIPVYRASTSFRPPEIPMKIPVGSEYFDTVDRPVDMIDTEMLWILRGTMRNGGLLLWNPKVRDYGIVVSSDGAQVKGWHQCEGMLSMMYCKPVEPVGSANVKAWPSNAFMATEVGIIVDDEDAYRAELVYAGLGGDAIRVVYREYSGDMARPAFSLDLAYDLSNSSTIAFRGLELMILEATNMGIRFAVEADKGWAMNYSRRAGR